MSSHVGDTPLYTAAFETIYCIIRVSTLFETVTESGEPDAMPDADGTEPRGCAVALGLLGESAGSLKLSISITASRFATVCRITTLLQLECREEVTFFHPDYIELIFN